MGAQRKNTENNEENDMSDTAIMNFLTEFKKEITTEIKSIAEFKKEITAEIKSINESLCEIKNMPTQMSLKLSEAINPINISVGEIKTEIANMPNNIRLNVAEALNPINVSVGKIEENIKSRPDSISSKIAEELKPLNTTISNISTEIHKTDKDRIKWTLGTIVSVALVGIAISVQINGMINAINKPVVNNTVVAPTATKAP